MHQEAQSSWCVCVCECTFCCIFLSWPFISAALTQLSGTQTLSGTHTQPYSSTTLLVTGTIHLRNKKKKSASDIFRHQNPVVQYSGDFVNINDGITRDFRDTFIVRFAGGQKPKAFQLKSLLMLFAKAHTVQYLCCFLIETPPPKKI